MAWRVSASIAVLCLVPGAAAADGFYLPGVGPSRYDGPRPSYRETYNDFPPPRGRYGGGIVEYVMTGGRSGVLLPPVPYATPVPVVAGYALPAYPRRAPGYAARALPRSGLRDYAPAQPPAFYGDP